MWHWIWNNVLSEFTDILDGAQITRVTLRLLVAAALGGLLGYEREQHGKSAGVRTHMLVAIGAALFVIIPQQAGASNADLSRVLQGLIAGVGFLGAGAIISGTRQVETQGLTTAAGIWVTCVFHDIRPVIPREGGHAFHVIPAACSSDSGQAVGAKRRGWLLSTLFLGVTSSWLSFSASILL